MAGLLCGQGLKPHKRIRKKRWKGKNNQSKSRSSNNSTLRDRAKVRNSDFSFVDVFRCWDNYFHSEDDGMATKS